MIRYFLTGTVVVLLACGSLLGSYDSAEVNILAGGYGFSTTNGDVPVDGPQKTYIFRSTPIITSGTLTRVIFRFYSSGADTDAAYLKVWSTNQVNPPYILTSNINITEQVNEAKTGGATRYTVDLIGLSIPVTAGQVLGIYLGTNAYFVRINRPGYDSDYYDGNLYSGSPTGTITDITAPVDIYVSSNSFIAYDSNNGGNGFGSGSVIQIPKYADQNYYIILSGVTGIGTADDANLSFRCSETDSSMEDEIGNLIIDNTPNTITLTRYGGTNVQSFLSDQRSLDIHIWCNPVTNRYEVIYVNYIDGQGGLGDGDTQHVSLTRRSPQLMYGDIRRINLSQTSGANLKVDRIVVCRRPVVAIGDSFTAMYQDTDYRFSGYEASLSHVGAALDNPGVFSQQRYVINGGITGDSLLSNAATAHSILARWDSTLPYEDLCAYRDVVFVFPNGPGLNDIIYAVNSLARQREYTAALISGLSQIARKALSTTDEYNNDVVLCQMIPYTHPPYANQYNAQLIVNYNKLIENLAYYSNIPMASMADFPIEYLSDDGTHPTPDGDLWIATKIAQAYENNVPALQCQYALYGDINGDCRVDFYDFAELASNWLIDCNTDPGNPQCAPR
jgi:lysophospholipase L1-like esterase